MRRPTIHDVAREAQVSKSTVGNVLAGTGRTADSTRQRVLAAADRLGYVRNRAARNLRTSAAEAIGIAIPAVVRGFAFYSHVTFGAVQAAAERGYDLLVLARDGNESAPRSTHRAPPPIDGALLVDPLSNDPTAMTLVDSTLPLVTLGHFWDSPTANERVTTVIEAPHALLLRQVLDRLQATGSRQPALLGLSEVFYSSWANDVSRGFAQWCADNDVEPRLSAIDVEAEHDVVREHVQALVDDDVDALICAPQGFAARTLPVLAEMGRDPGPELQLVSLVADPVTELTDPRITAVDIAPWQFGYEATTLLLHAIDGQDVPEHVTHSTAIRWGSTLPPIDPS